MNDVRYLNRDVLTAYRNIGIILQIAPVSLFLLRSNRWMNEKDSLD